MTDQYIGIDLHKAFFQACAVTVTGDRAWEDRFPRTDAGIAALLARCTRRTAMAVEASTPTWHFADAVSASVGDLRVVDPVKTKLKAGYAAKTDRLDARRFAEDYTSTEAERRLRRIFEDGQDIGVRGSPAFFLNGKRLVPPPMTEDDLERAILAGNEE